MFKVEDGLLVRGSIADVAREERYFVVRLEKPCPHDTVTMFFDEGSIIPEIGRAVLVHVNEGAEDEIGMGTWVVD